MSEVGPEQIVEALLFASREPLSEGEIQSVLGERARARDVLEALAVRYADRGVRLERSGGRWAFRTAPECAPWLARRVRRRRRLSRAALETLAVIAYNQPVTRAEIEAIRGVATSRGVLEQLIAQGLVAPGGRKEVPGRPVLWVTTPAFLDHFGLASLEDLPQLEELEAEGCGALPETPERDG